MAARVNDIYDAWIAVIESTLPGYSRLADPYNPTENVNLILKKGYGIGFGAGVNTERLTKPKMSTVREFNVLLTNQITATESNATARAELEKALFEDHAALVKAVEASASLNDGTLCYTTKWVSDTGVDFIDGERAKYFALELIFESEYFETLT